MALQASDHSGLSDISHRKNQSLMELTRIGRGIDPAEVSVDLRDRLIVLRERLDDNSRLLELHMEATAEVAGLITRALTDAESDGTYVAPQAGTKRNG